MKCYIHLNILFQPNFCILSCNICLNYLFLTVIPFIVFPEYGQSTTPLFLGANDLLLPESLGQATFEGLGATKAKFSNPK